MQPPHGSHLLLVNFPFSPKALDEEGEGELQWEPKPSSAHLYVNDNVMFPKKINGSFLRLPFFFHSTKARVWWNLRLRMSEKFEAP
jgi:hypothetical protein